MSFFKKFKKTCTCGHECIEHELLRVDSFVGAKRTSKYTYKCTKCECKEYVSDKDNPKYWDIVP